MKRSQKQTKKLFVTARIPQNLHRSKGAFQRTYNYFVRMYGQEVVDAVVATVAPGHMASAKLRRTMRKFLGVATTLAEAGRLANAKEQPIGLTVRLDSRRFAVFAPLAPRALVLSRPRRKKLPA